MASDLILCLDSGTTSVKAAVYDQNGTCLAHVETPNGALARTGNRVEQDMDQTLAEAEQAIVACVAKTGDIAALAITAQGDGLWPLTADFAPAGQAITWLDGRASGLVSEMPNELDEIEQITGARPTSASQTLQLLWLQANAPEKFASIRYALRLKEWLFYALTGSLCAENGSVLPVWGDWRKSQPNSDIPALLGLSKGVELLPDIGSVTSCTAGLSKQAAARLGLPAGLPVVLGPGDVQSSLVGLGVGAGLPLSSGSVFGTSAIHGAYYSDIDQLPHLRAGAMVQRAAIGEGFICFHPCFNGGTVLRHMSALLGAAMPTIYAPAYSGVVVLPFFEPGGERAPVNDPMASAAMFGLGADTTQDQINWAAREALAFLTRMSHTELKQGEQTALAVGGGVARDPVFLQLLASTLQRPVRPHIGGDTALRGLAATAMGVLDQGAQSGHPKLSYLAQPGAEIQPETGAVQAHLDRKYNLFETLLSSTSQAWFELAKVKTNAGALE
jgi:erythritol kinase (D-erythritol 1-phosphate-forming)